MDISGQFLLEQRNRLMEGLPRDSIGIGEKNEGNNKLYHSSLEIMVTNEK